MLIKNWIIALSGILLLSSCLWRKSTWGDRDIAERKIRLETIRNEDVRKKGSRVEWTAKTYDKRGHLLETKEFDKDSIVSRWERNTYNRQGKEVNHETLDSLGQLVKRTITTGAAPV